jgi:hypothetical protein
MLSGKLSGSKNMTALEQIRIMVLGFFVASKLINWATNIEIIQL